MTIREIAMAFWRDMRRGDAVAWLVVAAWGWAAFVGWANYQDTTSRRKECMADGHDKYFCDAYANRRNK